MSNPIDAGAITREYFPDADDRLVNYILWNCTGYPSFWKTNDIEACLREQLRDAKDGKCEELGVNSEGGKLI